MRKTIKLIEGGHHSLQDYRYICFTSTFLRFLRFFFQNPKIRDFLRFFALFRTFSRTMTTSGRVPTKSCLNEPHQIQLTMICVERRKGRSTYWYLWSGSVTLPTSTLCSQHSLLLRSNSFYTPPPLMMSYPAIRLIYYVVTWSSVNFTTLLQQSCWYT